MTWTVPSRPDQRWQEILRRASIALKGRWVGVWEADASGRLDLLAASSAEHRALVATDELELALRQLGELETAHRTPGRWVASRLQQRWCIAPVRSELPPPPGGVERRGAERLTLELAGVCIGLIDAPERHTTASRDADGQAGLASIVDQVPAILWTTDVELRVTSRSGASARSLDILPERVVGASLLEQYSRDEVRSESIVAHRRALAGEPVSYQIRLADRCYDAHVEPLRGEGGGIVGVVGLAVDVSDRERAFTQARRSQLELEDFVESAPVGIRWTAPDGTILRANPAELAMLGYGREEYVGRNIAEFHVDPEVAADTLRRLGAGETLSNVDIRMRHRNGSICYGLLSANARIEDGQFIHARCVTRDVTEREQQLQHGALHDALTDLPNRAYFVERLSQALARVRRDPAYCFAVLFLDFDEFKAVNDSLGHVAGDRLLAEIAGRLRTCVRPGDVVARLGGDEFTVLLEEIIGLPDAEQAARRIQDSFAAPFSLEGREILATASIGVALSEPGYGEPQDLLRDADLAMYQAKQQGRARFQVARQGMEADLRKALERHEFRLVFQPIVELESGRVHGFEALLRWHRPGLGAILPVEFVALAEQTGLILPIGTWVLQETCRYARQWQDASPAVAPVRMSVNLSAKQVGHARIVEEVRTALQDAGLAPSCLVLEIAESVLTKNVESSTALLHQLRELGVEVHMDNFGTGHASLSSLPLFPLQGIKVDRSFVHRIGGRRIDLDIVRSIVDLAGTLGLGVIAEGVETVAQRARLIAFGCELGQGFLLAKPLEPKAAAALLTGSGGSGRRTA